MRIAGYAVVLLFAWSLIAPTQAVYAEDQAAKKEIQALFDRAAKYIAKKDVDGLIRLASPTATFVQPGDPRPHSVKEWADETKTVLKDIENMKTVITVNKLTVKGKEATAFITETDDFGMLSDKGHKYHDISQGRITLMKTAKGWIATKFVYTSDKILRDGKPYTPPPPK